jgi:hypothetical protein
LTRTVPRLDSFRVERPGGTLEVVFGVEVVAGDDELLELELLLPHAAARTASGTTSRARGHMRASFGIDTGRS